MGDIYELIINEVRESLFQLECITTSLDNKAYGLIALNTILLSVFAYSHDFYKSYIIYIPSFLIIASLILVLICIIPRTSHRMTGENIIHLYGEMKFDDAAGRLALNYASLEKELNEVYKIKMIYFGWGLKLTIASIIIEMIVLSYLIFCP